jgi:hypothetical protein
MFRLTRKKTSQLEAMKEVFGKVLPICGVCNGPISGHMYKQIAVTPVEQDDPQRALALTDAVKRLEWEKLLSFQEFKGLLPAVIVYALKCPRKTCSLVASLDPSELWEPEQVLHQQPTPDLDRIGEDGFLGPL